MLVPFEFRNIADSALQNCKYTDSILEKAFLLFVFLFITCVFRRICSRVFLDFSVDQLASLFN